MALCFLNSGESWQLEFFADEITTTQDSEHEHAKEWINFLANLQLR